MLKIVLSIWCRAARKYAKLGIGSSLPEAEKYGLSIGHSFCPRFLFSLESFKSQVPGEALLPFDNGLLELHNSANYAVISSANMRIGESVGVWIM